jgi:hypothetical protein
MENIQPKRQNAIPRRQFFIPLRQKSAGPSRSVPRVIYEKNVPEAVFFPFRGCLFSEHGVFYLFVMNFST